MHSCAVAVFLLARFLISAPSESTNLPALPTMSLGEALQYARENRFDLQAAAARLRAAEASTQATRGRWYPRVGGVAELAAATTNNTTTAYIGVPTLDIPRVSSTPDVAPSGASWSPAAMTLIGIGLRQEVFDFGRISAAITAQDLLAQVSASQLQISALSVAYGVEEAYFALYAAKAILVAAQEACKRAGWHQQMSQAGVTSGMRRPIELTRANATLDRYELERVRAALGVSTAQSVFAASVGYPRTRLDITGTPPDPAELPSLDDAFARAAAQSPALRAVQQRMAAQEAQAAALQTDLHPELLLTASLTGNGSGATPNSGASTPAHGLAPFVPNWDVGLVLSWPLVDISVSRQADALLIEAAAQKATAEYVRIELLASVDQAYAEVQTARDAIPILKRALDASIANYEQANARFKAGMGDVVELADAEDLRTHAEVQLAVGTYELARARARLGYIIAEEL